MKQSRKAANRPAAARRKKQARKAASRLAAHSKSANESANGSRPPRAAAGEPWEIVDAGFTAAAYDLAQLPPPITVELAFAGRSNVGKSSLLNALLDRRRLVRTSAAPGCTRGLNFFRARARDGAEFMMVDLPGYGYAKRSKSERESWARLIEQYLAARDVLRAVVLLVDARRGWAETEQQLLQWARSSSAQPPQIIVAATKIDKVPKSKRRAVLSALGQQPGVEVISTSAVTKEGVGRLWTALRRAAHVGI